MEAKKAEGAQNEAPQNEQDSPKAEPNTRFFFGNLSSMLSVKEQKSLLFYIAIGIILVEFAVTVGALISGIAGAEQMANGKVQFNFPWTGYIVTVVVAPIIVILLVNLIGMGFYRAVHGEPIMSEAQINEMPEKARTLFSLVRGAPTIILFGGIVILGAVLYYLDGVMSLLLKLGDSVETLVIWGTSGIVIAWCLSYCARMWLLYRTRRLEEDYAYRREVLERTGMVILDKQAMLGSQEHGHIVVEPALPMANANAALEAGTSSHDDIVDVKAVPVVEAPAQNHAKPEEEPIVEASVETIVEPVIESTTEPTIEVAIETPVEPSIDIEPVADAVIRPEPITECIVESVIESEPVLTDSIESEVPSTDSVEPKASIQADSTFFVVEPISDAPKAS